MTVSAGRGLQSLSGKDPRSYVPHALHGDGRSYPETNCFTDLTIELLHACGYEPLAACGHLVRMDFEGDQWTFFKPPLEDLETLFGIDIHEMMPYRPLPDQIAEQIDRGRTIIVELDAFYLPDTASTSYRTEHVKTAIAPDAIDHAAEVLHYFHNAGLYELSGEDYRAVLRLSADLPDEALRPYTELVRFDAGPRLEGEDLRRASLALLRHHLERRPSANPFDLFGAQLSLDLESLLAEGLETYHAYAFATVRMVGAAFELAASYAEWLFGEEAAAATGAMQEIVDGCKALSFRLARRRQFDPSGTIEGLAGAWSAAMAALEANAG
jgi:hypothetical protein